MSDISTHSEAFLCVLSHSGRFLKFMIGSLMFWVILRISDVFPRVNILLGKVVEGFAAFSDLLGCSEVFS